VSKCCLFLKYPIKILPKCLFLRLFCCTLTLSLTFNHFPRLHELSLAAFLQIVQTKNRLIGRYKFKEQYSKVKNRRAPEPHSSHLTWTWNSSFISSLILNYIHSMRQRIAQDVMYNVAVTFTVTIVHEIRRLELEETQAIFLLLLHYMYSYTLCIHEDCIPMQCSLCYGM
jgi:hypothetical protein